jgi:hypothetical protein
MFPEDYELKIQVFYLHLIDINSRVVIITSEETVAPKASSKMSGHQITVLHHYQLVGTLSYLI